MRDRLTERDFLVRTRLLVVLLHFALPPLASAGQAAEARLVAVQDRDGLDVDGRLIVVVVGARALLGQVRRMGLVVDA